jgi:hypothetical protein
MIDQRFPDSFVTESLAAPSAFLVLPMLSGEQASPMQWLYQKLYEQAQAAQQPKQRDLFAVMN